MNLRFTLGLSCLLALGLATPVAAKAPANDTRTAETSLTALVAGNQRYASGHLRHPNQTGARIKKVAEGQEPIAAVLSCSDSRVPPELVFDQGVGDLFVVRNAGNIIEDGVLGSLEYAVEHLHVPLVMVLGHKRCGAVGAAVGGVRDGHLAAIVDAITPALPAGASGDIDQAVRANVRYVTEKLRQSKPVIAALVEAGKVKIVGGYYDLDTGKTELLAPEQH